MAARIASRLVAVACLASMPVFAEPPEAVEPDAVEPDAVQPDARPLDLLALDAADGSAVVRIGDEAPILVEAGDLLEPLGWRVVDVAADRLIVRTTVPRTTDDDTRLEISDETRSTRRTFWIYPRTAERPTWIRALDPAAPPSRAARQSITIPSAAPPDDGAILLPPPAERARARSSPASTSSVTSGDG